MRLSGASRSAAAGLLAATLTPFLHADARSGVPDEPPPSEPSRTTERARVELVLIPVSVHDAKGEPVLGLSKSEFFLYEEGAERAIDTFDPEPTPVSLAFALDGSGSMAEYFPFVKAAAIQFLQKLPGSFAVSLQKFGDGAETISGFTFNRSHLYYEINRMKANDSSTALFAACRQAADSLRGEPGRRAAVLFTDGEDTVVPRDEIRTAAAEGLSDARRAGAMFFIIGYGDSRERPVLEEMCRGTGGAFLSAGSGRRLVESFRRIGRELTTQYTLGITPSENAPPGTWMKIRVEVRRPGLSVTSRPGYVVGD